MTLANQETQGIDAAMLEAVVMGGDLAKMNAGQRLDYYARVCRSVGLNPLTKPFQYIKFQGGLTLYAGRNCTDQLAKIHGISLDVDEGNVVNGAWVVRATARDSSGRKADAMGAVFLGEKKGEALANELMKCETKAKRRAVLSFTGLSMLDATEVDTIEGATPVQVDEQGEVEGNVVDVLPDMGGCEWHNQPFTRQSTKGNPYHNVAQNFCDGRVISTRQGKVLYTREDVQSFEGAMQKVHAGEQEIRDDQVEQEIKDVLGVPPMPPTEPLDIPQGVPVCQNCDAKPALANSAYCSACEFEMFGDQQPPMIPVSEEH